jgi:hypothetical protein
MQEPASPYQSSKLNPIPALPGQLGPKPPMLTVFGVIHLVMAGIGVIMVIVTIGSVFMNSAIADLQGPEVDKQVMLEAQQATLWPNLLSAVFVAILVFLLIVAGIKLLRGRRDALRWSNSYAVTSIITKLISLVVTIIVVLPATRRMMESMIPESGSSGGPETMMMKMMTTGTSAATVLMGLIACTYPLLVLFLLNRKSIKDWLAAHGS